MKSAKLRPRHWFSGYGPRLMDVRHRTPNVEHRIGRRCAPQFNFRFSTISVSHLFPFNVRCSFPGPSFTRTTWRSWDSHPSALNEPFPRDGGGRPRSCTELRGFRVHAISFRSTPRSIQGSSQDSRWLLISRCRAWMSTSAAIR